MNITDLIVIYLACGAPFGVYYFLQNREIHNSFQNLLKTLLVYLFWFLYGILFLHRYLTKWLHNYHFVKNIHSDSLIKLKIDEFEKTFSNLLLKNNCEMSLFEFRETFERYTGLTISLSENKEKVSPQSEFFQIVEHPNAGLGQICLQRRNFFRLQYHQTQARHDLLKIFADMAAHNKESKNLEFCLKEFFTFFADSEAQEKSNQLFNYAPQTARSFPVQKKEIEVWNTKKLKKPTPKKTFLNLSIFSTIGRKKKSG